MRRAAIASLLVLFLVAVYVAVQGIRSAPAPVARQTVPRIIRLTGASPVVAWPARGQAMVEVPGEGSLGPVGGGNPVAIASLAKLMTAYVILHDHPLGAGTDGPAVQITAADAAQYRADLASGESVAPVTAGESLTEYQLLEALLVPSADNVAVVLADWDAGSEAAFVTKMNASAQALRMEGSHYADASGVSAATTSDAADQLKIAEQDMANPVFAGIVRQTQVAIPGAGVLRNYNSLVGTDGVVGIKTGSTTAAGGCFVFAAQQTVAGSPTLVLGVVLGQRGGGLVTAALAAGKRLLDSAVSALGLLEAVPAGEQVAEVAAPWSSPVAAAPPAPVRFVGWPGMVARLSFAPRKLGVPVRGGATVGLLAGRLGGQSQAVPVRADGDVGAPPLGWRLRQL